jgi:hypothetical protein
MLPKQVLADYNQMYMNQNNPLDVATQPNMMMQEPMAANYRFVREFGSIW